MPRVRRLVVLVLFVCGVATSGRAQTGENVLVVFNTRHPAAQEIANRYAERRRVPSANLIGLQTNPGVEIARGAFESEIETPIAQALGRGGLQDRVLYIVLIKGIPVRIAGTPAPDGTVSSVDSELALLYRKMTGQAIRADGKVANPYFLGDRAIAEAAPFSHKQHDIYLVTRLDGFSIADVNGLIDRGAAPRTEGQIVLDRKSNVPDRGGDSWLAATASRLHASDADRRIMLESTPALVTNVNEVLGYYSWGSNDPAWKDRAPRLQFVPGALVATFVSSDARTFEEPPPAWTIGAWSDPSTFYAGSPQSLIGDLIRGGATGAAGHVAEPYLDATIRPQVLFPGYLAGFNLAEAYYLAMPYLSWQTVVVGDPLCAPFRKIEIARDELDPAIDRQTELPGFFSPRRLSAAKSTAPAGEDVGALVLAESRVARGDRAGAMEVLESATAANDRALLAQFMLAGLYEEAEQFDQAIDRYQRLLKVSPDQASALNNLAYLLAVRKEQAGDALPLAERAHSLSRGNPLVADTLGWIYHLLGDPARASVFLKQAAAQAPDNAEIRLHAAVVFAELGDQQAAARELAVALRIDPRLASRSDVVALLAKLPPAPPH